MSVFVKTSFFLTAVITIIMLSIIINYYSSICVSANPLISTCSMNREKTPDESARNTTAIILLVCVLLLSIVSVVILSMNETKSEFLRQIIISIILIIVNIVTIFYPANQTNMKGSGSYWTFFSLSIVILISLITSLVLFMLRGY
jgi:hypothetical protein